MYIYKKETVTINKIKVCFLNKKININVCFVCLFVCL